MKIDELYRTHEWYIIRLAKYITRMCKVAVDDLKQEGFLGLVKANEMYDASRASFLTYAQYWIRVYMFSFAHDFQHPISLPGIFLATHTKYQRIKSDHPDRTDNEIFDEVGVTRTRGAKMIKAVDAIKYHAVLSSLEPADNYILRHSLKPEAGMESPNAEEFIKKVKKYVTPVEFFVMDQLLGLEQPSPKTLSWVGKVMNVTKERVRQIKNIGLEKLRKELGDTNVLCK